LRKVDIETSEESASVSVMEDTMIDATNRPKSGFFVLFLGVFERPDSPIFEPARARDGHIKFVFAAEAKSVASSGGKLGSAQRIGKLGLGDGKTELEWPEWMLSSDGLYNILQYGWTEP
jgi:hypothetical protein